MTSRYDSHWSGPWRTVQEIGPLTRSRYRLVLRSLEPALTAGAKVLDVGCGDGTFLALLSRRRPDLHLFGIEGSSAAVLRAPPDLRNSIELGEIERILPRREHDPVDAIVCSEVLEHVADPAIVLVQMQRALRPGGVAVLTVPAWRVWWSSQDDFAGHLRRFSPKEFRELLVEAGFREPRVYCWGGTVALLYDRLVSLLGPARTITAGRTPAGGRLARLAYRVFRIEDHLRTPWGFQLVAVARGGPRP